MNAYALLDMQRDRRHCRRGMLQAKQDLKTPEGESEAFGTAAVCILERPFILLQLTQATAGTSLLFEAQLLEAQRLASQYQVGPCIVLHAGLLLHATSLSLNVLSAFDRFAAICAEEHEHLCISPCY